MNRRSGAALAISLGFHGAFALLVLLVFTRAAPPAPTAKPADVTPQSIVWITAAGPGGGGGGGGNRMPEPARRAQLPGGDKSTVPVSPSRSDPAEVKPEEPLLNSNIPAQTLASADLTAVGALEGSPSGVSQGPGRDGGAGAGDGNGSGQGKGPGLGDGSDGGTGGRVYQPGNGISGPTAIYRETPHYTVEAMRARIQGSVFLQCVVQTTGTCTDVHVLRTPNPPYGLDLEAVSAALRWRFLPGIRMGQPVPVRITMELAFSIH